MKQLSPASFNHLHPLPVISPIFSNGHPLSSFSSIFSYFLLFLFLILSIPAAAQELAVERFYLDEADQAARITHKRIDRNNKTCAILKIETPLALADFTFDAGMTGIEHSQQEKGEIWVFLSPGARRLTLTHTYLGTVRNYEFGEPLREATVYIMKLTAATIRTTIDDRPMFQYLVANCAIDGATIKIDTAAPEPFDGGRFQKLLPYGKHTYTIEAPLYHSSTGMIEITAEKPEPLNAILRPAFGKLIIHTLPEQGAEIFINSERRGLSPLTIERIPGGEHTVRAVKNLFMPAAQKITVRDGADTTVQITLPSNFATVTLIADGDIYLNDERKAANTWNTRLTPGLYRVEVRKPSHRSSFTTIEARNGDTFTRTLDPPVPIYGIIDIRSNVDATVLIDDSQWPSQTPVVIDKILTGTRKITLQAEGYITWSQTVTIEENQMTSVNATLLEKPSLATLRIDANVGSAAVSINGTNAGNTPLTKTGLPLGKTTVEFSSSGYKNLKQTVILKAGDNEIYGNMEPKRYSYSDRGKILAEYIFSFKAPYGASVGYCKQWGFYLRYKGDALFSLVAKSESNNNSILTDNDDDAINTSDYDMDTKKYRYESLSAGVIYNLGGSLYLHGGLGYGECGTVHKSLTNSAEYYSPDLQRGLEIEAGLSYLYSIFYLSFGYHSILTEDETDASGGLFLGVGLAF
ncbi:MAG: PEGA domain-containing protein [Prevotellaceae bacterium]|jgi:hypothetical protein|nr:PEGA domain-containing protein [Prevotellaceae bacterium]